MGKAHAWGDGDLKIWDRSLIGPPFKGLILDMPPPPPPWDFYPIVYGGVKHLMSTRH